jgi:hypothetical protein
MTQVNYISYKDTAARVVLQEGVYYRYIFNEYKKEYDALMQNSNMKGMMLLFINNYYPNKYIFNPTLFVGPILSGERPS